jgi:hypothetical protein
MGEVSPSGERALCGLGMHGDAHVHAGAVEHFDQDVHAELPDLPANQIADPRLADAEELGGTRLGELSLLDDRREANYQLRSEQQLRGLFRREAKIGEHVAVGRRHVLDDPVKPGAPR